MSLLVAIAGMSDLVDSFGAVLVSGYALSIADVNAPKPGQSAPAREPEVAADT